MADVSGRVGRRPMKGWRMRCTACRLVWLWAAWLVGGCARPARPPGGPEDRIPPMVVSTWPRPFDTVPATRDPVRIVFSERLSERTTQGRLEDAVLVSPATGAVSVKLTRSGLEVSLAGGWREGLVYRVRVLPFFRDLFNNAMDGPFELVFSTGGAFHEHVVAGLVTDRLSGEAVEGARVEAQENREEGDPQGPVYLSRTDSEGIFALRYLPPGSYTLRAYQDVNRNGVPDFREPQAATTVHVGLLPPRQDTLVTQLALLRPDTTPAVLVRVEVQDSATLRFVFDDPLMPEYPLDLVQVTLVLEGEGERGIRPLLWKRGLDSLRAYRDSVVAAERAREREDSLRAVADSLRRVADSLGARLEALRAAGDTLAADSLERQLAELRGRILAATAAPPGTRLPPGVPPPPRAGAGAAPARPLPEQEFYAVLETPLLPDRPYRLRVSGVVNVNGIRGGGGEAVVTWRPQRRE